VQAIGFGTAPLAFREISLQQGVSTVHAALDCGIRLIDTALAYTREGIESYAEDLVRRALAQRAERIGLYQLHHVDPSVPLAESVGALRQLRDAGKIAEIGLSNVTIVQIEQARAEAPIATGAESALDG
jgi:aryl-alcohol dehydrogenase-like predicted oxidoreductase